MNPTAGSFTINPRLQVKKWFIYINANVWPVMRGSEERVQLWSMRIEILRWHHRGVSLGVVMKLGRVQVSQNGHRNILFFKLYIIALEEFRNFITELHKNGVTSFRLLAPPPPTPEEQETWKNVIQQLYYNDRKGKSSIMDTSRLRIGRHAMKNRLKCINELQFPWINGITDDRLRKELKKTFFN